LIVQGIGISFCRPYILFFLPEVKRNSPKVTVRRQILKRVKCGVEKMKKENGRGGKEHQRLTI
jgi:hypothetical protein